MKLAIGTTRAGLTLKKAVIEHLESRGNRVDDLGMKAVSYTHLRAHET